jgi:hypothetical protein
LPLLRWYRQAPEVAMAQDPEPEASPLRRRSHKAVASTPVAADQPTVEPQTVEPRTVEAQTVEAQAAAAGRDGTRARFWVSLVATAIVLGVIVGGIAAYAIHRGAPTYQSQALLQIDQAHAVVASPDDGVVAKLSRLRYSYAGLVRTQAFYGPLAKSLDYDDAVVASSVFTIVDPSSLLMAVAARGSDPAKVEAIAAGAAAHLVDFARSEQRDEGIPVAQQVTFAVVSPASQPVKIAPTDHRVALVGAGAFLFVALGTIGFGYLWRRDS